MKSTKVQTLGADYAIEYLALILVKTLKLELIMANTCNSN